MMLTELLNIVLLNVLDLYLKDLFMYLNHKTKKILYQL